MSGENKRVFVCRKCSGSRKTGRTKYVCHKPEYASVSATRGYLDSLSGSGSRKKTGTG